MGGTQRYVKFYVERSVEIVESTRKRTDLPKALVAAIQDFDNVMTGSAAWRRKNKPAVLAGAMVKITPSGQAVLNSTFVPFKETEGRRVQDVRYVNSAVGSCAWRLAMRSGKSFRAATRACFPARAQQSRCGSGRTSTPTRCARASRSFWARVGGTPEIERLMSPWVQEMSEGERETPAEAGAVTDGDGSVVRTTN